MPDEGSLLSNLLEALYEAPLNPSRWNQFLSLISTAVGGDAAAILLNDTEKGTASVGTAWNLDPQGLRIYNDYYAGVDTWRLKLRDLFNTNWVGVSDVRVSLNELKRTEFHADFLSRQDIDHGLFAMVDLEGSMGLNLSVYRSNRRGQFSERNVKLLRQLNPHLRRALRLHFELAGARKMCGALNATLESASTGVVLVNGRKKVVLMNGVAQKILAENDGLLETRARLRAELTYEDATLDALLARCVQRSEIASDGVNGGGALLISRRSRQPLQIMVSPIPSSGVTWCTVPHAVVLITDPSLRVCQAPALLKKLFNLTPAESRVALLLANGHSTHEIMNIIHVSTNTLKSHLSAIFAKTGASRQAQLVRLISSLPRTREAQDPAI